jgi:hypothetical protein
MGIHKPQKSWRLLLFERISYDVTGELMGIRNMLRNRTLILSLVMLTACAGNSGQLVPVDQQLEEKGYRLGAPVNRIQNFRLNSWFYVDRQHVILLSGPSSYYLVSLRVQCSGLSGAANVSFSTTIGGLMPSDSLVVQGSGGMVERCDIDSLHELERISE